jgi:uncharacterized membrane protein
VWFGCSKTFFLRKLQIRANLNTLHDKLWAARIFVYGVLLLLIISVGAILFTHFNLFHTDVNSARYMLSALVQSQAAIVAIVITLTLIAVQLTASAYSPLLWVHCIETGGGCRR